MGPYHSAYQEYRHRVVDHLAAIYPEDDHQSLADSLIEALCQGGSCALPEPRHNNWSQQDLILITYGDSIRQEGEVPLQTLFRFMQSHMQKVVSGVHILPFFPYSSDDGFSVIDYSKVNPSLGDWQDICAIADQFDLMSDLVLNHCSSRSQWFQQFKARKAPGKDYFIEVDPAWDLSAVVRPRTSPLLRPVQTHDGERHVWCTFSHDQVDLDFSNPDVLREMIRIIGLYLDNGVKIFRLDAVAFLWKEIGTSCINLAQTHEVIRLIRTLVEFRSPSTVLITETNIPNQENLSYFGNANEAHCIYNFPLPPLLLHTMVTGNCRHLKQWLMSMPPAQLGTAYFNFIASHDGIGLRPVEGMLEDAEIDQLAAIMETFGGAISWRSLGDGSARPYEINIALTDAMRGTAEGEDGHLVARFLCIHAIMLALEGIPGIYLHSFLGTRNDHEKRANTGNNRAINRHNWDQDALLTCLDKPCEGPEEACLHQHVFNGMKHLCQLRQNQPAFNPNATQFTLHLGEQVFAFWRQSMRRDQSIFCLYNVTNRPQSLPLSSLNLIEGAPWMDLISGETFDDLGQAMLLKPYQAVWLSNCQGEHIATRRSVGKAMGQVSGPYEDPNERRRPINAPEEN